MWYCQVYADAVAALNFIGCWMQLPADCVCSSHLVAHSTQKMLPCRNPQTIMQMTGCLTTPVTFGEALCTPSGSHMLSCFSCLKSL